MGDVIRLIRGELKKSGNEGDKLALGKFFKEKVKSYGLKVPDANKTGRKYYAEIKNCEKGYIFGLCEKLMASGYIEERIIAAEWAEKQADKFTEDDIKVFDKWVRNYISNWAECDTLCNHTVAYFMMKYPAQIKTLKKWARADNRWVKRASCVTLIIPARKGLFQNDIFELADILRNDTDDMVQKGYGWMLKAASEADPKKVFEYVMKHKKTMPRTAFRYAIEKMPEEMRERAMGK